MRQLTSVRSLDMYILSCFGEVGVTETVSWPKMKIPVQKRVPSERQLQP